MFSYSEEKTTKSERTRALLSDIAVRSFRERGYDDTTIRLIANEAGVSVGTTHYHFPTKNHLVQELYLDIQQAHRAAAEPLLVEQTDLIERLRTVYETGLDGLSPYHAFAPGFLSAVMSPRSPINPLSDDSRVARSIVEDLFLSAVSGAKNPLPAEFQKGMPGALFIAYLLLTLFWVYDSSPDQERTRRLLDRGLRLLRTGLPLMRLPLLRAPLRELLDMVAEVRA